MSNPSLKAIILKATLPVLIGIAVVAWLFSRDFSISDFQRITLSPEAALYIALALLMVAGREMGMMWRWRILTGRHLTWKKSFRVTMLCEFTSAITPTTAGGSALSMVFLSREGIAIGRATSLSMITLMLDQLFIIVMLPLILFALPVQSLFGFDARTFNEGVKIAFWIVYAGVCALGVALFLGALVCPNSISRSLYRLFSIRWLRRWRPKIEKMGIDMAATAAELRRASLGWWVQAIAATFVSWGCRFLVVDALFLAFVPMADQLVVFARQLVVWTLLTISPTPGGSGVSEWLFTNYYGDLLGGDTSIALIIAVMWRILSYYIYLLAGVFTLPWVFVQRRDESSAQ